MVEESLRSSPKHRMYIEATMEPAGICCSKAPIVVYGARKRRDCQADPHYSRVVRKGLRIPCVVPDRARMTG